MKLDSWFIIDWVENSCKQNPNAIAIIEDDTGVSITYKKLHERVLALTKLLQKIIVFPDQDNLAPGAPATPLVSLLTDRSIGSIIGMLSILKAGAAYVPVDPSFPPDRQAYIFAHSKSQLLIVDQSNCVNLDSMKAEDGELPPVVVIDSQGNFIDTKNFMALGSDRNALHAGVYVRPPANECLAYVLYTSGSTGKPKGVMVHNQGLVNVVNYFCEVINITPTDRVLGLTTFCFDISMLELYMPLTTGAAMVLVSAKTQKNPSNIIDVLYNYNITVMQATPTSYEMIMACGWEGDKKVTCLVGGEACRPKIIQLAHTCKYLYNVYGPTETSIWSSCYRFPSDFPYEGKAANQLNIPIGAPISLTSFYIVNEEMQLVKEGEEGELIIGGDGVAVGYLHAPDLTEKRFLPNPFGEGRIYFTGDLVVKLLDGSGNYTFVRRADDQVKVNGYRIELAEVELAIANHPKVAQAVVIVSNNALFGFLKVKQDHVAAVDADEKQFFTDVKSFAGKSLMPYMIPKYFEILDTFPTTANGKLDKLSLGKIASEYKPAADHHHLQDVNDPAAQSNVTTISAAQIALEHNTRLQGSMLKFVLQMVEQSTGSVPKHTATFAAVGIDSLAALLFRNVLSKSLGGVKIDQNLLYNVNTTIGKFSEYLFDRIQAENPALLSTLQITCGNPLKYDDHLEGGANGNGEGGDDANNASQQATQQETLGQSLLYHRRMMDGFRGFVAVLVLFDHFFDNTDVYGIREHADTLIFIMMTGFTIEVQNLTSSTSFIGNWNWNQFLWTRALGLFPIYWLTLFICIPRFYIEYNTYNLSDSRTAASVICYFFAVQTWSREIKNDLFYGVYYVSLIWGTFLVYAYLRWVYQATFFTIPMKVGMYLLFIGFAIGMMLYSPIGYFHPFFGCVYFALGIVVARVYERYRTHFPLHLHTLTSSDYTIHTAATATNTTNTVNAYYKLICAPFQSIYHQYCPPYTTQEKEYLADHSSTLDYVYLHAQRYRLSWCIDALCFIMLFIMFYHDYSDKDAPAYHNYDRFFYLYGGVLLFAVIMILSLYQSTHQPKSLFALILSETYIPAMIGEASYSLYLLQKIIVFFWFDYGIDGIRHGKWPYTRTFILYEDYDDSVGGIQWVQFLGVLLAIVISIFVQKVFQEKLIASIQIWWMQLHSATATATATSVSKPKHHHNPSADHLLTSKVSPNCHIEL